MVGTSLESFDFYVFAYFSAFFVGPLFFEPLGSSARSSPPSRRSPRVHRAPDRRGDLRPHGRPARPAHDTALDGRHHGRRDRRSSACCRPTPRPAGSAPSCSCCCASPRACRSAASGAARSCSRPSTPGRVKRAFYAAIPQLGSPVGSILSAALFIVMTLAAARRGARRVGLAHPVPHRVPAAARLAVPAVVDRRDAGVPRGRRRGPPRPRPVRHDVPRAPGRDRHRDRRRAAGHRLVLADEHVHDQLRRRASSASASRTCWSRRRSAVCCSSSRSRCSERGRRGSARRGSSRGARSAPCSSRSRCTSCCSSRPSRSSSRTMIVGGILPTMSWAALGGLMNDLFPDHFRYSALSISYAIAATSAGSCPLVTLAIGEANRVRLVAPRRRAGSDGADHAGRGVAGVTAGRRARARPPRRESATALVLTRSVEGWPTHHSRLPPRVSAPDLPPRLEDGPAAGARRRVVPAGVDGAERRDGCRARAHHRMRNTSRHPSIAST